MSDCGNANCKCGPACTFINCNSVCSCGRSMAVPSFGGLRNYNDSDCYCSSSYTCGPDCACPRHGTLGSCKC